MVFGFSYLFFLFGPVWVYSFVCGFRFWPILFAVLRFWMNFSTVLRFLAYPNAPLMRGGSTQKNWVGVCGPLPKNLTPSGDYSPLGQPEHCVDYFYYFFLWHYNYKNLQISLETSLKELQIRETPVFDHSNESYWAVLSCGAVKYAVAIRQGLQDGSNFKVCGWRLSVGPFKWKLLSSISIFRPHLNLVMPTWVAFLEHFKILSFSKYKSFLQLNS